MLKKILLFLCPIALIGLVSASSICTYAYVQDSSNPNLMEFDYIKKQSGSYKNSSFTYSFNGGLLGLSSASIGSGDWSISYNASRGTAYLSITFPTAIKSQSETIINYFNLFNDIDPVSYQVSNKYSCDIYLSAIWRNTSSGGNYFPYLVEDNVLQSSFDLTGRLYLELSGTIHNIYEELDTTSVFSYESSQLLELGMFTKEQKTFVVSSTYEGSLDPEIVLPDTMELYKIDNGIYAIGPNRFYYQTSGSNFSSSSTFVNVTSNNSYANYSIYWGSITFGQLYLESGDSLKLISIDNVEVGKQYYQYIRQLSNNYNITFYWSYTSADGSIKTISIPDYSSITEETSKIDFEVTSLDLCITNNSSSVIEYSSGSNVPVYNLYYGFSFVTSYNAPVWLYYDSVVKDKVNQGIESTIENVVSPVYPFNLATYKLYYSNDSISISSLPNTYVSLTYEDIKDYVQFSGGLTIDSSSSLFTTYLGNYYYLEIDFGSSVVSTTGFNTFVPSGENSSVYIYLDSVLVDGGSITNVYSSNINGVSVSVPDNSKIKKIEFLFSKGSCSLATNTSYSIGYNSGYTIGENKGYENGRIDGYNSGYTSGSEAGYIAGKKDGLKQGHASDNDADLLGALATSIFNFPLTLIKEVFNVEILGINLFSLISFFISIVLIGVVIKLIKGVVK